MTVCRTFTLRIIYTVTHLKIPKYQKKSSKTYKKYYKHEHLQCWNQAHTVHILCECQMMAGHYICPTKRLTTLSFEQYHTSIHSVRCVLSNHYDNVTNYNLRNNIRVQYLAVTSPPSSGLEMGSRYRKKTLRWHIALADGVSVKSSRVAKERTYPKKHK